MNIEERNNDVERKCKHDQNPGRTAVFFITQTLGFTELYHSNTEQGYGNDEADKPSGKYKKDPPEQTSFIGYCCCADKHRKQSEYAQ